MPLKWVELNIKVQVAVDSWSSKYGHEKTNLECLREAVDEVNRDAFTNDNFMLLHYDIRNFPVVLKEDE